MKELKAKLGEMTPEEIEIAIAAVKLYRLNKSLNENKRNSI